MDQENNRLLAVLLAWIEDRETNGIKQQTDAWHIARILTIGGSSMATIQGINPYASIYDLIAERIGISKFRGDIKPQWGNLFEDIAKRYVEYDTKCTIYGEDLYVLGPIGTSYSPDGLAVIDHANINASEPGGDFSDEWTAPPKRTGSEIVLMEFKCPFSRIPAGYVPKYYIPQVKMGLDLLKIPTIGLFMEAVIRRCTWDQLGYNSSYDRTLVPKSSGVNPLAYGIIGFYISRAVLEIHRSKSKIPDEFLTKYTEHYVEYGNASNEYMCNDLGEAPVDLFTLIMASMDRRLVQIRYYPMYHANKLDQVQQALVEASNAERIDADLAAHTEFCRIDDHINIGILPWKLFRADYHYVTRENGYLDKWYPLITEIVSVIRICNEAVPELRYEIIMNFIESLKKKNSDSIGKAAYRAKSQPPTGFSDGL